MIVLKKKEIVATALVAMIGVAGYLNWSYQDTIKVTDGDSYIETGKKLGEAKYVNSDTVSLTEESVVTSSNSDDYFAQAKMEKENARSKALEILKETAENESFDADTRKNAQDRILSLASNSEKETIIENISGAKGYENISVYIDGESVDIIVEKADFSQNDVNIIKDIVTEQLNIGPNNIKIVQKSN